MNARTRGWDWRFVGLWALAGTVGITVFGLLAFASVWSLGELVGDATNEGVGIAAVGLLFGALMALGLSLGSGLLLRSRGVPARGWIGWSALTGAIGMGIAFVLLLDVADGENLPQTVVAPVLGMVLGLSIGLGQWRALGERARAGLWPVIVAVALVVAMSIGMPLGGEGREWLALGVVGLLASVLTGLGMGWLLSGRAAAA